MKLIYALLLATTSIGAQTTTEIPEPTSTIPEPFDVLIPEDQIFPNDTIDPSIVNGQRVQPNEIPWQAFLIEHTPGGKTSSCGGSLVRPTWVFTAAHCIQVPGSVTQVLMGSVYTSRMPYAEVANLRILHSGYNAQTLENDVGLVRLPRPASGAGIALIPMAAPGSANLEGVPVQASGWGSTSDGAPTGDELMKANLRAIQNAACAQAFSQTPIRVVESTLCAAPATSVKQSVCHGDSGGPLTISDQRGQHVLVGVTSFVNGPNAGCEQGHPQGFARVSLFSAWANEYMNRFGG